MYTAPKLVYGPKRILRACKVGCVYSICYTYSLYALYILGYFLFTHDTTHIVLHRILKKETKEIKTVKQIAKFIRGKKLKVDIKCHCWIAEIISFVIVRA